MPSCDSGDKSCTCSDCREMDEIRNDRTVSDEINDIPMNRCCDCEDKITQLKFDLHKMKQRYAALVEKNNKYRTFLSKISVEIDDLV